MTRLTDLPPAQAQRLAELECPDFETRPWVTGPALSRRRDSVGPVTQGFVSKSGHSSSARRCDCAGGKSVNRVTASLLQLQRTLLLICTPRRFLGDRNDRVCSRR